jgi:type IV pilus assembly protein PilB
VTTADDFVIQLAQDKGLVSAAQVAEARRRVTAAAAASPATLPSILRLLEEDGVLAADAATALLAAELGMERADLGPAKVGPALARLLPRDLAQRYQVVPLERRGDTLRVAVGDPLNVDAIDSLAHVRQGGVEALIASPGEIVEALERIYGRPQAEIAGRLADLDEAAPVAERSAAVGPRTLAETEDAPVIRLVHALIHEAFQRRASDIHLEPLEKRFRLRYRIDGVLQEMAGPPKRLQLAVISRLKIMAHISIAEKRVPQDGRIQIELAGKAIDLRVSCLPTAHGESIVMRILDKEGLSLGLPELGLLSDDQDALARLINLPDGILLVTGPTGSGKTTTLYSCLHSINQPDRKIITVEDPVEYQLSGINQVPVRPEVGMTFASALRAMLRQAPNIVMVGEIRDRETAEIAINASLTGHLVFSTLHTNDAPGAVTRLADIGVKRFLIASSLRATLAQRLVRRICAQCREPHQPTERELRSLNLGPGEPAGATFMRGRGCAACHGTGYRGRMGIFEIFPITDEVQRMIYEGAGGTRLREKARDLGMRTMREDGLRKALAGLTTVEEVVSITVGDSA